MKRKIPNQTEIEQRIEDRNREKLKEAREQALEAEKLRREKTMDLLYDKSLKMYFHSAAALEAHDLLVPTAAYNKSFKRDGNNFMKHLSRVSKDHYDRLYKDNPEYTTNMFDKIDKVVDQICAVEFKDYPVLLELLNIFHQDKDHWRETLVSHFRRLDSDLENEKVNEENND